MCRPITAQYYAARYGVKPSFLLSIVNFYFVFFCGAITSWQRSTAAQRTAAAVCLSFTSALCHGYPHATRHEVAEQLYYYVRPRPLSRKVAADANVHRQGEENCRGAITLVRHRRGVKSNGVLWWRLSWEQDNKCIILGAHADQVPSAADIIPRRV